ncbi:MAG: methyltransferase domain-containing protein [Candidatus Bathyarchaeia archaeon]
MNEALELQTGQKVLEVGAGTGYHASTVAEVVAPLAEPRAKWGHVWAVEIVPQLANLAKRNVEQLGYGERVTVIQGDGSMGLPEYAPFDRVLVTAAAPDVPEPLTEELKPGGILLIPVGDLRYFQELLKVKKAPDGSLSSEHLGGVAFVPLRGKKGWRSL